MEEIDTVRMQELALRSVVARRCRRAYLHDMRGGIQAIASSFELLNRAANAAPFNQALAGKAAEFFRRAVDSHERLLEQSVADLCGPTPERTAVGLESFAQQALKFLQNDAAARQVNLQCSTSEPVVVQTCSGSLRLLLLALLTHAIDHSPAGGSIRLSVERLPRTALVLAAPNWAADRGGFALIREVGSRLMSHDGGCLMLDGPAARVTLSW